MRNTLLRKKEKKTAEHEIENSVCQELIAIRRKKQYCTESI